MASDAGPSATCRVFFAKMVFTRSDCYRSVQVSEPHYPPEFVAGLQMQWGAGFLSPGGPEEVCEIFTGVNVAGKTVLDIGCGIAGPAMVIAKDLGASKVVGIDIENYLIETGCSNVVEAGLDGRVELKLVEVGPLPFPEASFDIVFSKDSLIHVEDKTTLYKEVLRVLKPGGVFAASDWLRGEDAEERDGYNEWRSLAVLEFTMQTDEETQREMRSAGMTNVRTKDRSKQYVNVVAEEIAMMHEPDWREQFVSAFGEAAYARKLAVRAANGRAAECGGLRLTHLYGQKL